MPNLRTRAKRATLAPPLQAQNVAKSPPPAPNIGYTRLEVSKLAPKWNLVEDCLEGQDSIKEAGETYLPKPNSADTSDLNSLRYDAYVMRAVFYNVTSRTLEGLVGQVFSRDPITAIPDELKSMVDDVDGSSVSLDQQSKKGLMHSLSYGGFGLLVDYPFTDRAISLAEQKAGFIRPTITQYPRKSVINWRTIRKGALNVFSLIVIRENGIVNDDGFETTSEQQWRVLQLDDDGEYVISVWIFNTETSTYEPKEGPIKPTDGLGNPLTEIPFYFCGVLNNNAAPDRPPLYDLAVLNIAHYRNSADYEDSCYVVGQPTPVFAGLSKQWVTDVFKNKPIQLGSRGSVALPVGGTASMLQVNPNTMPKEAMDQKEIQMAALGAKLVETGQGKNTLGQAQLDESTESSMLATAAKNVSLVYTKALNMAAKLHNVAQTVTYSLNTDFPASRLTPNERTELVLEWQAGAITVTEMRAGLRKAGVATLDFAEYKAELVANPPPIPTAMTNNGGKGGAANAPNQNPDANNNGGNQGNQ